MLSGLSAFALVLLSILFKKFLGYIVQRSLNYFNQQFNEMIENIMFEYLLLENFDEILNEPDGPREILNAQEPDGPPENAQVPRRRRRRREIDALRDDLRGDLQFQHLVQ